MIENVQLDYHSHYVCRSSADGRGIGYTSSSLENERRRIPQWKQNGTEGAGLENHYAAEGAGLRAFSALFGACAAASIGEVRLMCQAWKKARSICIFCK